MKTDCWKFSEDDCNFHNIEAEQEHTVPPQEDDDEKDFSEFARLNKTCTLNSYFGSEDKEDDNYDDYDDSIIMDLQPHKPKTIQDYYSDDDCDSNSTSDHVLNQQQTGLQNSVSELTDCDAYILRNHTVISTQAKKDNAKRLTLQDMQSAIVSKISLIIHNGGLYYYNGRTYKAISNSYELLGLVRSHISLTAFSSSTTKQFVDLLIYLKADPNLIPANYQMRLNQSKYLVVLRNGVLDLRTLKLLHHSPKYLTFHEFDAEFVDRKPNAFLRFIRDVGRGDPEIALRITESVGFLLSGMNSRYFFVAGTAQCSGKSTLGLLLQHLIGEEQVSSLSTHQLDSRFSLGGTRNKILNIAMDVPKGHLSAITVSLLKTISGGDPINIEEKYQPTERIVSRLRFLFGTNYKISVPQSEDEDAFWDRMVILPFQFPAEKINYSLLDDLINEKDEIVSYCLRAMSRVLANNCRFSECQVADDMKAEWRNSVVDMKSFENFWYENIDVTGDPNDEVFAMELYQQYQYYCRENNLEIVPQNRINHWIAINAQGECIHKRIHRTNENPRSGFSGIKLMKERKMYYDKH